MSTGMTPAPAPVTAPAPAPAGAVDIEDLLAAPLGLRERKKLKTRRGIRVEAFRLFREQGYDSTTVDQIAAAADVSPSTFFRYFPTKEDLIITDDYDPLMVSGLRSRPPGEPLLESIRQTLIPALRTVMAAEREEMMFRTRMLRTNQAIRDRSAGEMMRTRDLMVGVLAEREGERGEQGEQGKGCKRGRGAGQVDLLALRATVAAVLAACGEAVDHWASTDGAEDIADVVERALDAVTAAFQQ
ncbi:TetR family transcriptional regulator [Streptacidiphilus sp. N1-3]|uniref:TetR family transcriptional regulator n=1 Tax=Streptacidiphilus alkalitolerans TaxID=3342712 RepID=A0ABV6X382_9ACTN